MLKLPVPVLPIRPIFRTIFTLIILASLMAPTFLSITESAKAETYLYDGTTTTSLNVIETTTVHVSKLSMLGLPNGSKFIYNMTIPTSYSDDGFSHATSNVNLGMTTSPTGVPSSFSDQVDSYGNHYRRYIFNMDGFNGSDLYITCTASFDAVLTGNAGKVNYTDALGTSEQSQYLAATTAIQAGNSALINKNNELLSGVTTEAAAVDKIMNFVKTQIPNQASQPANEDAVSSLSITTGTCVNRAYLALGLLRSAGIPSRYVTGMLYGNTITYHINNGGYTQTNWGSGLHAWVEVYYPQEHVWVPYDPFMDKGFLDTRHIQSGISMDGNASERANHGDFNLAFAGGVNQGVQAIITNAISVSNVKDTPQLNYLYTKSSPPGQVMYARDMQFSPANIPSATPTVEPTPTVAPNNTTITATPNPNATINYPSPTPTVVPGSGARYKLSGSIIDAATGAAIPNATIMLDAIQVNTNQAGKFTFIDALATGTYNLSIDAPGYAPYTRTITGNNTDMDLTIRLTALSASPTSSSGSTPKPSPAAGVLMACIALAGGAMLLWRKREP